MHAHGPQTHLKRHVSLPVTRSEQDCQVPAEYRDCRCPIGASTPSPPMLRGHPYHPQSAKLPVDFLPRTEAGRGGLWVWPRG